MSKEKIYCGFCGREVEASDTETGYLTFPDNISRPVHLTHRGVKEEYDKQIGTKND
jgi:hypothetical protein